MGFTTGGPRGVGAITSPFTPKADLGDVLAVLAARGGHLGGISESARDAVSGASLFEGLTCYNLTKDTLEVYDGSGWVVFWKGATTPGSVTPTAGSGFTLSANTLYTRNGFLLGNITWAKTSGTLGHADAVMTLPVGARPAHEYIVPGSMGPSPFQVGSVAVTAGGVATAITPPSGRTGGTFEFVMPIPL